MKYLLIVLLGWSSQVHAGELYNVLVGGDKQASLLFEVRSPSDPKPAISYKDNTAEVTFRNTTLSSAFNGKLEVLAPHTLIQRVSVFQSQTGIVKAVLVLNGSMEGIQKRVSLKRLASGYRMSVSYPAASSPSLALLANEQKPILNAPLTKKSQTDESPWLKLSILAILVLVAGLVTFLFVKLFRRQGNAQGTRKYLIEQLSHFSLGPKMGVSLLKIGSEFLLIGITPGNVSLITKLGKLSEKYDEDSELERDSFKDAVKEEMGSLNNGLRQNIMKAFSA